MKLTKLFIMFIFITVQCFGQYSTPGTTVSWNLDDLVTNSGGVVTKPGIYYLVNNNLTISLTDTLKIFTNDSVKFSSGVLFTVGGTLITNPIDNVVFTSAVAEQNYLGVRFENSSTSYIKKTVFEKGGGVKLISSNLVFDSCIFKKNNSAYASGAIDVFQSNPVIKNCMITENARSGIISSANSNSVPQILHNIFLNNGTSNANYPQINLGASNSIDTIKIIGNIITGINPLSGGIAVSTLAGGNINCLLDSNIVENNRYGIAVIGNNIKSEIKNNILQNNNIQNVPNLGGSGINLNGDNTNISTISRNTISGNLWGVTLQGTVICSMGGGEYGNTLYYYNISVEQNHIFNNSNSGIVYNVYNNTINEVQAKFNFWESIDAIEIETGIFHKHDNSLLEEVSFEPFQHPVEMPYIQLPVDGAVWSINMEKIVLIGDTLISGKTYRKLYHHDGYNYLNNSALVYYSGIREDISAKKIFTIFANETNENILYDYNLILGDTITIKSNNY